MPDTAPTAPSTPMTLDQRRASSSATGSPWRSPIQCATSTTDGNAMPKQAKMMWKPSDAPIWLRAGTAPASWASPPTVTVPTRRRDVARGLRAGGPLHGRRAHEEVGSRC